MLVHDLRVNAESLMYYSALFVLLNLVHVVQLQALKKAFIAGAKPLPETMVAVARLFGTTGQPLRGKEILAAMEKLNYNPRVAWLTLVGK